MIFSSLSPTLVGIAPGRSLGCSTCSPRSSEATIRSLIDLPCGSMATAVPNEVASVKAHACERPSMVELCEPRR
jgi:hypothetical protein